MQDGSQHYFDGVKDMLRFYLQHHKKVAQLFVQDYYTTQTVDAKKSFFVIGSDLYGPMGKELIAHKTRKRAERFSLDHKGRKILTFEMLDRSVLDELH